MIRDGVPIIERNRFSHYVKPSDQTGLGVLASWLEWFRRDTIPATIVLTDKGYALYRTGMGDGFDDDE